MRKQANHRFLANTVFKTDEMFAKKLAKASQTPTLANTVHEQFAKHVCQIRKKSGEIREPEYCVLHISIWKIILLEV